jgi:uncharacterized membrane protein YhaH (DUF805 family)
MADGNHRAVQFMEAGPLAFKNFANFQGRSSRGAYWWFILADILISFVLGFVDGLLFGARGTFGILSGLWTLATIIPSLSLGFRRMHDVDKSAWWLLIGLVPILGLVLIYFAAQPGTRATNNFGPDTEAGRPEKDIVNTFS